MLYYIISYIILLVLSYYIFYIIYYIISYHIILYHIILCHNISKYGCFFSPICRSMMNVWPTFSTNKRHVSTSGQVTSRCWHLVHPWPILATKIEGSTLGPGNPCEARGSPDSGATRRRSWPSAPRLFSLATLPGEFERLSWCFQRFQNLLPQGAAWL